MNNRCSDSSAGGVGSCKCLQRRWFGNRNTSIGAAMVVAAVGTGCCIAPVTAVGSPTGSVGSM